MVNKQFINSCSRELSIYQMKQKPQSLRELTAIAEQSLTSHNSYQVVILMLRRLRLCFKTKSEECGGFFVAGGIKCYNSGKLGHRTSECFLHGNIRLEKSICNASVHFTFQNTETPSFENLLQFVL